MFHAKLNEGILIKKLIDAIKDLVSDINLDISAIGISISNLAKVLRCGGNEDSLTLSCEDEPSKLKIRFENNSKYIFNKNKI